MTMSVCLLCGADSPNQEISPGETTTTFYQLRVMKHFNPQECITMPDFFFLNLRTAESFLMGI